MSLDGKETFFINFLQSQRFLFNNSLCLDKNNVDIIIKHNNSKENIKNNKHIDFINSKDNLEYILNIFIKKDLTHDIHVIWLSNNDISKTPNNFHCWNNLKMIYLQNNKFTCIPFLPKTIEYLNMEHNQLSSLNNIENYTKLKEVKLGYNFISEIPSGLHLLCTDILYLGLSNNKIKDLPHNLPNKINHLILSNNYFNEIPKSLNNKNTIQNLQTLDFSSNNLSTIPKFIFDFINLTSLCLHNNKHLKLDINIWKNIFNLKKLCHLGICEENTNIVYNDIYDILNDLINYKNDLEKYMNTLNKDELEKYKNNLIKQNLYNGYTGLTIF